jgi:hypothetical protein
MAYLKCHSISWTFNQQQTTRVNCERLRELLLHLHPPQSQGTNQDVICEHALTRSLHLRYNGSAQVTRSVWSVPLAASWNSSSSRASRRYKGTFTHIYQSAMSLSDFNYLDGRDGELVVKELAAIVSHS